MGELTPRPGMGQEGRRGARVAELVDARDLKSLVLRDVPVRFRPRAPNIIPLAFDSIQKFNKNRRKLASDSPVPSGLIR